MDLPKIRAEAQARGLTRYFTGKPCPHGHVVERFTKNGGCVECERQGSLKRARMNAEQHREYSRQYRQANPEMVSEAQRKWREANPEKTREYHRKRYDADPAKQRERVRQWQKANPEKRREWRLKDYTNNPDKYRERLRQWFQKNPEKHREYYADNREKIIERVRKYYVANAEKRREYSRKWGKANLAKKAANQKRREAQKRNAVPAWLSEEHMQEMADNYEQAALCTELTGVPHEVDHIEPLQGEDRCGLHVPWNLQILTAEENRSKNNRPVRHVLWKKR